MVTAEPRWHAVPVRGGGAGRASTATRLRRRGSRSIGLLVAALSSLACGGARSAEVDFASTAPPAVSEWALEPESLLRQPLETASLPWTLEFVSADGVLQSAQLEGFSAPEVDAGRPFVWAMGARSTLRFPLEQIAAVSLDLRARPFVNPGSPPQHVSVTVNGEPAGSVELADGTSEHLLPLPVSALRVGWNELGLGYAWSREPREVIPGNRDARPLAVAYERLRLVQISAALEYGLAARAGAGPAPAIAQRASGAASWLFRVPTGAVLELAWVAPLARGRTIPVRGTLEHDHGTVRLFETAVAADGSAGSQRVDLAKWASKAVRLRLSLAGLPAGTHWLWTRADLEGAGRGTETAAPAEPGLNVVVVVLDAAQRDRFGLYGGANEATPRIDALARESLVFERVRSTAPYTLASTASLFTSQLPPQHGVIESTHGLGVTVPTLGEAFQKAGYATAAFSANAFVSEHYGLARGFERFVELFQDRLEGLVVPSGELSDAAIAWLAAHQEDARSGRRPFFLYLHYVQPHEPYDVAPEAFYRGLDPGYGGPVDGSVAGMYAILEGRLKLEPEDVVRLERLYEGNLRYADAEVGRLLDALRTSGLLERTLVVVTSDHGEALGERGLFGHNTSVDEAMTAIPLVVRFPESFPQRPVGRSDTLVSTIDVAPLVLESVGVAPPPAFAGRNPLRRASASGSDTRILYARTPGEHPMVGLWSQAGKCSISGTGRVRAGSPADVDAGRTRREATRVSRDLCAFARLALETAPRSHEASAVGALSGQDRAALEALGYLRGSP